VRECTPDDRLRDEAVHASFLWLDGLLASLAVTAGPLADCAFRLRSFNYSGRSRFNPPYVLITRPNLESHEEQELRKVAQ
jgi:hypothetical protein